MLNAKNITQKRWFLPAVCVVSFLFGWWYLSVVTCAPLGGDDEYINLLDYYYATHTSWTEVVKGHLSGILDALMLQTGRFRPFSSPPVISLNSYLLGDLVVYRYYILAWTYADIALTAWLVGKATRNKTLGVLCFCALPMMFSLWQDATGNSLYSYGALVQSTLLPVLLAGLCMLRMQDTGHRRWGVFSAFWMFMACGTFEIGFTYIVALFGFAWIYLGKGSLRPALRLTMAPLAGEIISFGFNMGSRVVNILRAAGILPGSPMPLDGVSPNFDIPAILRTWVMQMSAGFPLNSMIAGKMRPGPVSFSDVLCGVVLALGVVVTLYLLAKRLPDPRENLLLFLTGFALLGGPAMLVAVSPKYQDITNVDWRHGYIPQTVESYGVGLMAAAVLVLILRRMQKKQAARGLYLVGSVLLCAGITFANVWQRSAARIAYEKSGRAYTVMMNAASAGLADSMDSETPLLTDYMIWGGYEEAEQLFFLCYGDNTRNAKALQVWRQDGETGAACRYGYAVGDSKSYDIAWLGTVLDDAAETVDDVTVYLAPGTTDGFVCYNVRAADGTETEQRVAVSTLAATPAKDGGQFVSVPQGAAIVGDTLQLVRE